MSYKDKQLLEDIYDLVKATALSDNDKSRFAELSHTHADEADVNLHAYLYNKNMEWDGDKNTIKIGKHIIIQLTIL